MTDTSEKIVRVGNMTDTQMSLTIVGPNGDKEVVLLQPKAATWLPAGFNPAAAKKGLYVFPDATVTVQTPVPAAQPATASTGGTAGSTTTVTDGSTTK